MQKKMLFSLGFLVCFFPAICQKNKIAAEKKNGALVVSINNDPVLYYHYQTVFPPDGVDSAFRRSGFIHPLKTLNGHVLTQIQPQDHYHHYGIWNPWTHVLFEGDTLDFWNLIKRQGTVRFAGFNYINVDDQSVEFQVKHEHVVLKDDADKVALREVQTVKITYPGYDYYVVDFTIDYKCATNNPFRMLEYRYGGFGWRATEKWNDDNSKILTSEGNTRKNADASRAKWCMVQGELGRDYGGILILSNPENYNYPEPLRVWPATQKNEGSVFVNYSPTKNTDWLLEPGKTYTLKYRLIVFDGELSAEKADSLWKEYIAQD